MNFAHIATAAASSLFGTFRNRQSTGRQSLRSLWRLSAGLIACGILGSAAEAQTGVSHRSSSTRSTQRVILKPKRGNNQNTAADRVVSGSRVQRIFQNLGGIQVLELPSGMPAQIAIALLKQANIIDYAEADQVIRLRATEANDFRYWSGETWSMHNTGYLGGTPGADIKASEAWDIRHDAPNVIVALVDSGVWLTHEDLAPNLWRNPREIPGNGIDDDGNGVIDDVYGFNAWADNGNPMDDIGHGTHVAGSIGAVGNNSVGVVGVSWKVQLMPTKFTDPQGEGTVSDAIACIDYARQMGANIINASWGGTELFNSTALRDAIAAARDAGIIFVTVAGNNAGDNDATPYYPGAFDLDNIIVTTATNRNDELAFFANYGARTVDLGAPGQDIFSCWSGSDANYQYLSGGSMAVAHVSGAAALVRAQYPGDDYKKIIRRILDNVDPLPTLQGKTVTGGRLNVYRALGGGATVPATVTLAATDAAASETGNDPAVFQLTRTGSTLLPLTVAYTVGGTATNGKDYATLTGVAIIPAGATSTTVTVQPIDDSEYEGSETVTLTLAAGVGYQQGASTTATATLADNDAAPLATVTVAATDAAAAEAGTDTGTVTITRTGGLSTTAALTVNLAVSGTATAGTDYTALPATATIPAGAASTTLTIRPIDDTTVEGSETVIVTVQPAVAYAVGGAASATITIADNDQEAPPPAATKVSIRATSGYALELGFPKGEFTITRQGGSTAAALTVRLTVSGTAAAGVDYQALPATVTIPAGKTSTTVTVTPIRDRLVERTETVIANIAPGTGYAAGTTPSATVYIVDDDWLLEFLRNIWTGGN